MRRSSCPIPDLALLGLDRARSYLAVGKSAPTTRKIKSTYVTRLKLRPAVDVVEAWDWVVEDGDTDDDGAFVALAEECRAWGFSTVGQVENSLGRVGVIEMIDRVLAPS